MAEELQGLLDRIQSEGIAKAEAEKTKIVEDAKAEAAKIVAAAKEEAASIVKKANEDAEISVTKGNAAIKQAARDVLIALRADIEARLKNLVTESVGEAMTPETMGKIILEMVKAYSVKKPSGDATVELLLSQKDADAMTALFKGALLAQLQANPVIRISSDVSAGLQIGFKGTDVFLDFSDEALADVICAYVGPKLAAALKG
ncbi:MAG TPA: hypothetical protein DDZ11_01055 [Lentisphaeria bacterium]|nr:hypothetical protein [Lentisphaeria bacterium]